MKNELQNLTDDISRLYEGITQKTESLGQIEGITRLYDELQTQHDEINEQVKKSAVSNNSRRSMEDR
jgi:hypothetical protein